MSLSLCVSDVLAGRYKTEEIKQIIAATQVETHEEWNGLIDRYKKTYWREKPEEGEKIARQLLAEGKIRQPRTKGREVHNIARGHWIDAKQVEAWEEQQCWK